MDWNGDGNHDWRDDAFFHNVINSDENSSNSTHGSNGSSSSGIGSGWVIAIIILIIISFFFCFYIRTTNPQSSELWGLFSFQHINFSSGGVSIYREATTQSKT